MKCQKGPGSAQCPDLGTAYNGKEGTVSRTRFFWPDFGPGYFCMANGTMAPGRYPERSERPVDTFPDLTGRMAVAQITDHIVFNVVVVQEYRDSRQLLIWAPYHDLIHKCNYRFKYYNAFYCERLSVRRCIANKTARSASSVRGPPYLRYFWPFQNGPDVFKGPPFCT